MFGLTALALIPEVPPLNGDFSEQLRVRSRVQALGIGGNGNSPKRDARWYRIDVNGAQHPDLLEAFRGLRTSILLSTPDQPPSSLLITSTQPVAGKTKIASNLAMSLAQIGKTVLLVDADLRFPSLHRLFGKREPTGMVEYLTGHIDWHAAVCSSGLSGLDLLFCGPLPPNPSELFSSQRMDALIKSAREQIPANALIFAAVLALAFSTVHARELTNGRLFLSERDPRSSFPGPPNSNRSEGRTMRRASGPRVY